VVDLEGVRHGELERIGDLDIAPALHADESAVDCAIRHANALDRAPLTPLALLCRRTRVTCSETLRAHQRAVTAASDVPEQRQRVQADVETRLARREQRQLDGRCARRRSGRVHVLQRSEKPTSFVQTMTARAREQA